MADLVNMTTEKEKFHMKSCIVGYNKKQLQEMERRVSILLLKVVSSISLQQIWEF